MDFFHFQSTAKKTLCRPILDWLKPGKTQIHIKKQPKCDCEFANDKSGWSGCPPGKLSLWFSSPYRQYSSPWSSWPWSWQMKGHCKQRRFSRQTPGPYSYIWGNRGVRLCCFHDCWGLPQWKQYYFDQLNFTSDCHDHIAVTHHRNYSRLSTDARAKWHCELATRELSTID